MCKKWPRIYIIIVKTLGVKSWANLAIDDQCAKVLSTNFIPWFPSVQILNPPKILQQNLLLQIFYYTVGIIYCVYTLRIEPSTFI